VSNTLARVHAIAERWTVEQRRAPLLTHILRRWLGGKWLGELSQVPTPALGLIVPKIRPSPPATFIAKSSRPDLHSRF